MKGRRRALEMNVKGFPGSKSERLQTKAQAEQWLADNKTAEKVITKKVVQKRSTRSLADRIQVDEPAEIEAVEPPFSTFLRGSTSPSLPSLGDPELFDKIFLQAHSSQQFQVMRHFGDSLLRATTFDVLTDVLGRSNYSAIMDTVSMAVSNAFYESLFRHYGFADLCVGFDIEVGNAKVGKSLSEKRGDILEAYFAGIDMDFSREGTGSKEVRDWLFQVLALRLGPQHKSQSTRTNLRNGRRGNRIWWESSKADWPEDLESRGLPKRRDGISDAQDKLNDFRDEIFEHMRLMVKEIYSNLPSKAAHWGPAETQEFWEEMRRYFDAKIPLKEYTEDHERVLLYYYQSYVCLKLDDGHSAQRLLGGILLHKSSLFNSKIHKETVRRLLSIRLNCCTVEIECDDLGRSGVSHPRIPPLPTLPTPPRLHPPFRGTILTVRGRIL